MALFLTVFVRVWFADGFVNGVAGLGVGLVVYLLWVGFREKRLRRKERQQRGRQRPGPWGYDS